MRKAKRGRPKKKPGEHKVFKTFRIRPDLLEKAQAKADRIEASLTYVVERALMRELIWDE